MHRKNGKSIKKCPTFEEMKMIKEKLFSEEEVVFQLHPREEDYINTHPYCLHLWKSNDCNMIVPPLNSVNSDELTEGAYFEHEGIIVRIKTGEFDGWQVARVYCFTKDGRPIKSSPTWDVMCEAKSSLHQDRCTGHHQGEQGVHAGRGHRRGRRASDEGHGGEPRHRDLHRQ